MNLLLILSVPTILALVGMAFAYTRDTFRGL
jgi:hypothetical protein